MPIWEDPCWSAGDLAGAFSDRPKVRQFVEYLSTGESTRPYLEAGVRVSPHKDSDPNWYPAFFQGYADILADATVVRFDGSDLMPGVVGTGTFWTGMVDWVEGEDLDAVLRAIDESWPAQTITVTLDADGGEITTLNNMVTLELTEGSVTDPITVTITTAHSPRPSGRCGPRAEPPNSRPPGRMEGHLRHLPKPSR